MKWFLTSRSLDIVLPVLLQVHNGILPVDEGPISLDDIVIAAIQPHIEPLLRPNQNGFRAGRSITQHILALQRISEECTVRKDSQCVATFIDFSKAFVSISRSRMEDICTSTDFHCSDVNVLVHNCNSGNC